MDYPIQEEVIDLYREHAYHSSYHANCSTCYKEKRLLHSWEVVNRQKNREALGRSIQSERERFDDPNFTRNPLE